MRGYDDGITKNDLDFFKKRLTFILEKANNNDLTYGEAFKELEYLANDKLGVSYEEYIKENTLGFLEYVIENDRSVDELGEYIESDIYYTSICHRLWSNFEYEASDEFYEDSTYIDRTEKFEMSYVKIKELLYKGVNRKIYEACEKLDLEYEDLSKIDKMKLANYYDDSMYEKELKNKSFSFSKGKERDIEF